MAGETAFSGEKRLAGRECPSPAGERLVPPVASPFPAGDRGARAARGRRTRKKGLARPARSRSPAGERLARRVRRRASPENGVVRAAHRLFPAGKAAAVAAGVFPAPGRPACQVAIRVSRRREDLLPRDNTLSRCREAGSAAASAAAGAGRPAGAGATLSRRFSLVAHRADPALGRASGARRLARSGSEKSGRDARAPSQGKERAGTPALPSQGKERGGTPAPQSRRGAGETPALPGKERVLQAGRGDDPLAALPAFVYPGRPTLDREPLVTQRTVFAFFVLLFVRALAPAAASAEPARYIVFEVDASGAPRPQSHQLVDLPAGFAARTRAGGAGFRAAAGRAVAGAARRATTAPPFSKTWWRSRVSFHAENGLFGGGEGGPAAGAAGFRGAGSGDRGGPAGAGSDRRRGSRGVIRIHLRRRCAGGRPGAAARRPGGRPAAGRGQGRRRLRQPLRPAADGRRLHRGRAGQVRERRRPAGERLLRPHALRRIIAASSRPPPSSPPRRSPAPTIRPSARAAAPPTSRAAAPTPTCRPTRWPAASSTPPSAPLTAPSTPTGCWWSTARGCSPRRAPIPTGTESWCWSTTPPTAAPAARWSAPFRSIPAVVGLAQHEFGHTFTDLADEYTTPYPGFPPCSDRFGPACEPNVTDETRREEVKWGPFDRRRDPAAHQRRRSRHRRPLPRRPLPRRGHVPAAAELPDEHPGRRLLQGLRRGLRPGPLPRRLGRPRNNGIDYLESAPTPVAGQPMRSRCPATRTFGVDLLQPLGNTIEAIWKVERRRRRQRPQLHLRAGEAPAPTRCGSRPATATRLVHPAMAGNLLDKPARLDGQPSPATIVLRAHPDRHRPGHRPGHRRHPGDPHRQPTSWPAPR